MANVEQGPTNLNKQLLADQLSERVGLSRSIAQEVVETVFDICAWTVAQGYSVSITNFGSMELVEKKARMARNPQTGDRIQVPSHKAVRFNVSPRLNQFANSDKPELATIRKRAKGPSQG